MANKVLVSVDKWRDGVKFLMGLGANPTLTTKDQRMFRDMLRGPFVKGMTEREAQSVLAVIGWYTDPAKGG
jgi:hypothetical protein